MLKAGLVRSTKRGYFAITDRGRDVLATKPLRIDNDLPMQFEEVRIVREPAVDLQKRQIEVIDHRTEPAGSLAEVLERVSGLQVWAEGEDRNKGKVREHLQPAEEFIIYSTPPSPQDLQAALEAVKPARVHVFAVSPKEEKTEEFLARLAGLAKYVINQRGGKATLAELAGVTAQRQKTIR